MRRALWIGLVLLVAGSAMPASAASAEFQGNCTNSFPGGQFRTDCVFNAQRTPAGSTPTSCSPSSISSYFWDFGNGNSLFTSSSFVSQTYFGAGIWDICVAVFCANGSSAEKCHCMANNIGLPGCVLAGAGWTP